MLTNKFTDKEKLDAIQQLLDKGIRSNEWCEAGLLHAVDQIVMEEVNDLTPETIALLVDDAKDY